MSPTKALPCVWWPGLKSRSRRSSKTTASGSVTVVRRHARGWIAARPSSRMIAATRPTEHATPRWFNATVIRRHPAVLFCSANSARTSRVSHCLRAWVAVT